MCNQLVRGTVYDDALFPHFISPRYYGAAADRADKLSKLPIANTRLLVPLAPFAEQPVNLLQVLAINRARECADIGYKVTIVWADLYAEQAKAAVSLPSLLSIKKCEQLLLTKAISENRQDFDACVSALLSDLTEEMRLFYERLIGILLYAYRADIDVLALGQPEASALEPLMERICHKDGRKVIPQYLPHFFSQAVGEIGVSDTSDDVRQKLQASYSQYPFGLARFCAELMALAMAAKSDVALEMAQKIAFSRAPTDALDKTIEELAGRLVPGLLEQYR